MEEISDMSDDVIYEQSCNVYFPGGSRYCYTIYLLLSRTTTFTFLTFNTIDNVYICNCEVACKSVIAFDKRLSDLDSVSSLSHQLKTSF